MKQSNEIVAVAKWLIENNKKIEDLKDFELEMKMVNELQNKGEISNPSFQYFSGDSVSIMTTSTPLFTVGVSHLIDDKYIYLRSFYIPKEHRKKGVGRQIFNEIKQSIFENKKVKYIQIEATKDSKAFWFKMGFKVTHKKNVLRLWN